MLFPMPEKKAILNLRLDPNVRDEFATAAKLRGASMSGLIHQFIVRTIREEKAEAPYAFGHKPVAPVVAHIGPAAENIERQRIERQLKQGMKLAPSSGRTMPAKLKDKTDTQAKRKAR